ncbi:unnamed protein product [Amoebophrya sp. A25]|nr:unnamed protein product [Amoebophrya sp. A25]|eukprot:GSA25T00007655001.1
MQEQDGSTCSPKSTRMLASPILLERSSRAWASSRSRRATNCCIAGVLARSIIMMQLVAGRQQGSRHSDFSSSSTELSPDSSLSPFDGTSSNNNGTASAMEAASSSPSTFVTTRLIELVLQEDQRAEQTLTLATGRVREGSSVANNDTHQEDVGTAFGQESWFGSTLSAPLSKFLQFKPNLGSRGARASKKTAAEGWPKELVITGIVILVIVVLGIAACCVACLNGGGQDNRKGSRGNYVDLEYGSATSPLDFDSDRADALLDYAATQGEAPETNQRGSGGSIDEVDEEGFLVFPQMDTSAIMGDDPGASVKAASSSRRITAKEIDVLLGGLPLDEGDDSPLVDTAFEDASDPEPPEMPPFEIERRPREADESSSENSWPRPGVEETTMFSEKEDGIENEE